MTLVVSVAHAAGMTLSARFQMAESVKHVMEVVQLMRSAQSSSVTTSVMTMNG